MVDVTLILTSALTAVILLVIIALVAILIYYIASFLGKVQLVINLEGTHRLVRGEDNDPQILKLGT